MSIISIGTTNKAKILAVQTVFKTVFESCTFQTVNTPSNVSAQPCSDEETVEGAKNRALGALQHVDTQTNSSPEFGIGLEGGVKEFHSNMFVCNWVALAVRDGPVFVAGGAQIPLPEHIANSIRAGKELGPLMDEYAQAHDTRQNKGAIGIFTDGLVNRSDMFEHIVRLVVGQYLHWKDLQKPGQEEAQ